MRERVFVSLALASLFLVVVLSLVFVSQTLLLTAHGVALDNDWALGLKHGQILPARLNFSDDVPWDGSPHDKLARPRDPNPGWLPHWMIGVTYAQTWDADVDLSWSDSQPIFEWILDMSLVQTMIAVMVAFGLATVAMRFFRRSTG